VACPQIQCHRVIKFFAVHLMLMELSSSLVALIILPGYIHKYIVFLHRYRDALVYSVVFIIENKCRFYKLPSIFTFSYFPFLLIFWRVHEKITSQGTADGLLFSKAKSFIPVQAFYKKPMSIFNQLQPFVV